MIKKLSNRARMRAADAAVAENLTLKREGGRLWVILASVLAELGGEIIVSDTSRNLVGAEFHSLDYRVEEGPEPGTSLVRLLDHGQPFVRDDDQPDTRTPELTITRVEE